MCVTGTCWYKIIVIVTFAILTFSGKIGLFWSSFKNKCYENQGKLMHYCSTIITQGFTGGEGVIFREVSWGSSSGNKFTSRMAHSCMGPFFVLLCQKSVCKSNIGMIFTERDCSVCNTRVSFAVLWAVFKWLLCS